MCRIRRGRGGSRSQEGCFERERREGSQGGSSAIHDISEVLRCEDLEHRVGHRTTKWKLREFANAIKAFQFVFKKLLRGKARSNRKGKLLLVEKEENRKNNKRTKQWEESTLHETVYKHDRGIYSCSSTRKQKRAREKVERIKEGIEERRRGEIWKSFLSGVLVRFQEIPEQKPLPQTVNMKSLGWMCGTSK